MGLVLLLPLGCEPGKISVGLDTAVTSDGDADTDTDSDTDADSDTDTDTGTLPVLPDYDILVDCEGGGDYLTIQEAIDAATSGDTIALEPCEYHERIDYRGKYLNIYGREGSENTTIDADYGGTVVDVEVGESDFTRLAGVSIEDGYDPLQGSGIEVYYSSIKLEDVRFVGNGESNAVAYLAVGFVDMIDVVFDDNDIIAGGSAIYSDGGSLSASRVEADCGAGSYALYQHNATVLLDSTLTCDAGYGLVSYHGEVQIKRSRLEGGISGIYAYDEEDTPSERAILYASVFGGGVEGARFEYMTVTIGNSVFWGPTAGLVMAYGSTSSSVLSSAFLNGACGISGDLSYTAANNAFWGNTADTCGMTSTSSVTSDPMFVSFPDDLTLGARSPLIDAGYSSRDWNDLDGSRNDIGRFGGPWAE